MSFHYFLELSPELQVLVARSSDQRDISHLCQTSRTLYKLCLPVLYRHVDLSWHTRVTHGDFGKAPSPWPEGWLECQDSRTNLPMRQNAFLKTVINVDNSYFTYIRSMRWTVIMGLNWRNDEYEYGLYCVRVFMEFVKLILGQPAPKREDNFGVDFFKDINLSDMPGGFYVDATALALAGQLDSTASIVILRALTYSSLVYLCLDTVQDVAKMYPRPAARSRDWDLRQRTVADVNIHPEGFPSVYHPGAMRKPLSEVTGRCTALRSLTLKRTGVGFLPQIDGYPINEVEEQFYEAAAAFLLSVKPTLRYLHFDQGLGPWAPPEFLEEAKHAPAMRPPDQRFLQHVFPVLASSGWPCLETIDIKGVGYVRGVRVLDSVKEAQLRKALGGVVRVVVRDDSVEELESARVAAPKHSATRVLPAALRGGHR